MIRIFLLLLIVGKSVAQIDTGFVSHLMKNGLKHEHERYLMVMPASDSVLYQQAVFHLKYLNDSLFLEAYKRSPALCDADSVMLVTAGVRFLKTADPNRREEWFQIRHADNHQAVILQNIYLASVNPNLVQLSSLPGHVEASWKAYRKIYNKKPLTGALLSAAVPGLGKLYAGKPASALSAFIIHVGYAAQTAESGYKLGYKHPLTIINAAAFGVFYFANIYGGFHAVKQLRKERRIQFLTDATVYYN